MSLDRVLRRHIRPSPNMITSLRSPRILLMGLNWHWHQTCLGSGARSRQHSPAHGAVRADDQYVQREDLPLLMVLAGHRRRRHYIQRVLLVVHDVPPESSELVSSQSSYIYIVRSFDVYYKYSAGNWIHSKIPPRTFRTPTESCDRRQHTAKVHEPGKKF